MSELDDSTTPAWLLCTALPAELKPLLKRLRRGGATLQPVPAWRDAVAARWHGERVVLGTIGFRATKLAALEVYLAQVQPRRGMVLLGLAGGLSPLWRPTDVALAEVVATPTKDAWTAPAELLEVARAAAETTGFAVRGARLFSRDQVAGDVVTKRALAESTGCDLVDMEAAAFAQLAEWARVPWLCARAVLDAADEPLPPLERLAEARGLSLAAELLRLAATQPRTLFALPRIGRRSAACGNKLAMFAEALVAATKSSVTNSSATVSPGLNAGT